MKKRLGTMDVILIVLAIFLLLFVVAMVVLYYITGGIPDTLCNCVFAVCGGECGAMAWIKNTKERHKERRYELEDRNYNKKINQDGDIG